MIQHYGGSSLDPAIRLIDNFDLPRPRGSIVHIFLSNGALSLDLVLGPIDRCNELNVGEELEEYYQQSLLNQNEALIS